MLTVSIPPRPTPVEWRLTDPCGTCEGCARLGQVKELVDFMNEHFFRAVEKMDPRWPGYLRAVDRIMAERDVEVGKIASSASSVGLHCLNLMMTAEAP